MAAPYLVEIRTGGQTKKRLRDIIDDVSNRFSVYAVAKPRAVPHISLFGPYNTNRGREVKSAIIDVLSDYDTLPYKIKGFGGFSDKNVVYAEVRPSRQLREARQRLSDRLQPVTYNFQPWDEEKYFDFHVTIAFKDVGRKYDDILEYLQNSYELEIEEYATRITNLRKRSMMWEFDVPRGEVLRKQEATSRSSWEKTNKALKDLQSPGDHEDLAPAPGFWSRLRNPKV